MSPPRYSELLPWKETRRAAAVLRAARVESGMTQDEVAEALGPGWSQTKVGHAETAATRMRRSDALLLAELLGVDPAGLGLEGTG